MYPCAHVCLFCILETSSPLTTRGSAAAVSWLLSAHCLQERVREEASADQACVPSCSPRSEHMIERHLKQMSGRLPEEKEGRVESRVVVVCTCHWNVWETREEGEGRYHCEQVRVTEQRKEMLSMSREREKASRICIFTPAVSWGRRRKRWGWTRRYSANTAESQLYSSSFLFFLFDCDASVQRPHTGMYF